MPSAVQRLSNLFSLPEGVLAKESAKSLTLAGETRADVLQAVLQGAPFPDREIPFGSIALEAATPEEVALNSGSAAVKFGASFRGSTGLAVLDSPDAVLSELPFGPDTPLNLKAAFAADSSTRYLVFRAGYSVDVSQEGTHPIGAFGSVSVGTAGKRQGQFAFVKRIEKATPAHAAIGDLFGGLTLPRHVDGIEKLRPGTMLVSEVDGSIAFDIAATLGYDFNFVRELESIGITGDVGLKLDLGLKATLGFRASGRYLISLDRPSLDEESSIVRLRLFRLSQRGWNFGQGLSASVTSNNSLTDNVDDFVKAVFGVHGQQIVKELQRIEEWSDPSTELSSLIAGITSTEGLALLKRVTGVDPEDNFEKARGLLVQALQKWNAIPERAANAAWELIGKLGQDSKARAKVLDALDLIAEPDDEERRAGVVKVLDQDDFENTPIGRFLSAIATNGLLALVDDVELPQIASRVRNVVDGNLVSSTLEGLKGYIDDAFDLEKLVGLEETSWEDASNKLNSWLVSRISAVLGTPRVDEVRTLIHRLVALRKTVYQKALAAANRKYNFSLAAQWQKTTTKDVLLDVEFDLSKSSAARQFKTVMDAKYDQLLSFVTPGVRVHTATMSHGIERKSSIEVTLPFYNAKEVTLNEAIAKVEVQDEGDRVLVYRLEAKDEHTAVNRFRSQLCVSTVLGVPASGVRVHSEQTTASWSYTFRLARSNMTVSEMENRLYPLVDQYFPTHFPQGPESSLHKWLRQLDHQVESITGNGDRKFGDVLLSLDVRLAGNVVAPWLAKRSEEDLNRTAKFVSLRLQKCLRELIPLYYLQDLDKIHRDSATSALLLWSSLRLANDIRIENGKVSDNKKSDNVYWDWRDSEKRKAMVRDQETLRNLSEALVRTRELLRADGRSKQASFFQPEDCELFIAESRYQSEGAFRSLLLSEAELTEGIRKALHDMAKFRSDQGSSPSRALKCLADFGAKLTKTFHSRLSSLYGNEFLRPLGSILFLEAARAMDHTLEDSKPQALLSLTVLREGISYKPEEFLQDVLPHPDDVAVRERLVSAASR